MYLTYYYLSLVGKELLQAHSDKYSSSVKLLFAIISYLATVNRYLTIFFFFPKNKVAGKISLRWSEKKTWNYWKIGNTKNAIG